MITKSDVENWKADPVTKAYFESCEERIDEVKELLASSAGIDPVEDNFRRGFIYAYRERINFSFEEDSN